MVGVLALVSILAAGCGGSHRCSGTEITLRAVPAKGQRVTPAGMQVARQIMTTRLAKLGVSSPTVTVRGDEIVVHLAGADYSADVPKIIGTLGQLQLFDFEPSLAPPTVQGSQQPAPLPSLYSLLSAAKKEAKPGDASVVLPLQEDALPSGSAGAGSDPSPAVPALQGREAAGRHGGAGRARESRAGRLRDVDGLPGGRPEPGDRRPASTGTCSSCLRR